MSSKHRIAIVDLNKCKPSKCEHQCQKRCPPQQMGKKCIEIEDTHAKISEELCIGCASCTKASGCPFGAIAIINIPKTLDDKDTVHRYGQNGFKLFRLPQCRKGVSYCMLGSNGVGKSTAVGILGFKTIPNFGDYDNKEKLSNLELSKQFRGTYLQDYFKNPKKVVMKNQHIEILTKSSKFKNKTVKEVIDEFCEYDNDHKETMIKKMDMEKLLNRKLGQLSGGESQRLYCLLKLFQKADVYIFDEFTNFLDIGQRIRVANLIKENVNENNITIVVEHDLVIARMVSTYASILYGIPGAYGVVSMPQTISHAINMFLDGYIPSENMRFRDEPFVFKNINNEIEEYEDSMKRNLKEKDKKINLTSINRAEIIQQMINSRILIDYPAFSVKVGDFQLDVDAGKFILNSGITIIGGNNGIGKTLLLKVFAGQIKPENVDNFPSLNISYKPQHLGDVFNDLKGNNTVRSFLHYKIGSKLINPEFKTDVINTLGVDKLMEYEVDGLSGGQLQIVAIALALGVESDLILIDEPSNSSDVEVRFKIAKAIKNFVNHNQKSVFVVDHDITMLANLGNSIFGRMIVFDGEPGVKGHANPPMGLKEGMNLFLKQMNVTMRPDKFSKNGFCKINKFGSQKHNEQVKSGNYFIMNDSI